MLKSILHLASVCLACAYVALLPQFYLVYEQGNRYTLGWSATSRSTILIALALLAFAYAVLYGVFRGLAACMDKFQGKVEGRRLLDFLVVWFLTFLVSRSLMALAHATEILPAPLLGLIDSPLAKFAVYVVLPAGLLLICPKRYAQAIGHVYRVLAILFLLFLLQAFGWDVNAPSDRMDALPQAAGTRSPANSLYIFLFDEWDYDATLGNPQFPLTNMPHLSEFLGQATLFRNAFSPGVETTVSIPRFLFQPDERTRRFSYSDLRNRVLGNRFPPAGMKSIFDLSDHHFKCLSGVYLHYPDLLGPRVDCCIPVYDRYSRHGLREGVQGLLSSQIAFLEKFGISPPIRYFNPFLSSGWIDFTQETQRRMRPVLNEILVRVPSPNITFFHVLLPHPPTLVNRDWTPRPYASSFGREAYWEGLYAVDALIGDFVRILRERGEYDSALIAILSDHGLKDKYDRPFEEIDPGVYVPAKHVPLILKYPGQKRGGESMEPVLLMDLHPLFRDFLAAPEKVAAWVSKWNAAPEGSAFYAPE